MKRVIILLLAVITVTGVSGCSLFGDASALLPGDNAAGTVGTIGNNGQNAEAVTTKANSAGTVSSATAPPQNGTGLPGGQGKMIGVTLYFATGDNSAIKKEEREVQVIDGAILKACVLALMEGPRTAGLHKTIPDGTKLLGISLKNGVATVDFSGEFAAANDIEGAVEKMSLVNTLTEIQNVDMVRIHINGSELIGPSGKPVGEIGPAALDANGRPTPAGEKTIKLYYSNSNADAVVAEQRSVQVAEGEPLERSILLELMKGPETPGLHSTIPAGTRLLSVKTVNGLCTVDFSSEFVDNSPGGTASESMTINSVVDSLTELDYIDKVQFLIDGQKRQVYTHAVFDKPFVRNESIIGGI